MQSQFNTAALARLPQSELLALLAEYRARLNAAGEVDERLTISAQLTAIEAALSQIPAP